MKKILYIILFVPFTFLGQSFLAIEQDSPLELSDGWNMIGYTCYEPKDVIVAFTQIVDKIVIVKDNGGAVYMPDFSFNGIGDLERGRGYQIKLTEAITDFQFCPFIVPLVEGCMEEGYFNYNPEANVDIGNCEDFIFGCMDATAFNFNPLANTSTNFTCYPVVEGCLFEGAYNYNDYDGDGQANALIGINGIDVNTDDGSCLYLGCLDSEACNYNEQATTDDGSCEYAQEGYDCDGNINVQVGDEVFGGIVFYVDETGQHGLVAAIDNLTIGAADIWGSGIDGYQWGCYMQSVSGADEHSIGEGYQNTIDVVNELCQTWNGGITAAEATLNFDSSGYNDWYLPSYDELIEMYNSIGQGSEIGNIGNFNSSYYWSSTEANMDQAYTKKFNGGYSGPFSKVECLFVRPIRSF